MTSMTNGRDLLDFRVHGIRQPMLIVWGAQDELIPIKSGETIHKAVPQLHLAMVEGCGHLAPSECSRAVLKLRSNSQVGAGDCGWGDDVSGAVRRPPRGYLPFKERLPSGKSRTVSMANRDSFDCFSS